MIHPPDLISCLLRTQGHRAQLATLRNSSPKRINNYHGLVPTFVELEMGKYRICHDCGAFRSFSPRSALLAKFEVTKRK
ncbi:hypothetical protein AB3S75_036899 [Citrus x aurantiifolia]